MASELVTTKGYNMPVHAIPPDHEVIRLLIRDICLLLSIDPNDEKNEKRLPMTELMIRESANRLTIKEIQKAFVMYAKGELSGLEPRDNYLTPVLFNKVVTQYKQQKKVEKPKEELKLTPEEEKANALQNILLAYDYYKEYGTLERQHASAFHRLYDLGIMPKRGPDPKVNKRYDYFHHKAHILVWEKLKKEEEKEKAKPGASTPRLLEIKKIFGEMYRDKYGHPDIKDKAACLVLESYFSKTEREILKILVERKLKG
jgi:hypothetical protein